MRLPSGSSLVPTALPVGRRSAGLDWRALRGGSTTATIFAIPKAFAGPAGTAQRRALASWTRLDGVEIVLFGDEDGVAEAAADFGAVHVPSIERTDRGTPLVSSAFARVHELCSTPLLWYANADIAFLGDVPAALRRVEMPRFLVAGRRLNVDPGAAPDTVRAARRAGRKEPALGSDYFVFPADGSLARVPPFAVGRPAWDNWMISNARRRGIPVVDASRAITAVHPVHGYDHVLDESGAPEGPEADANRALRDADDPAVYSLRDAPTC